MLIIQRSGKMIEEELNIGVKNATLHNQSRFAVATGQNFPDQAPARTGHTIHAENVRADAIPVISTILERNRFYLISDSIGTRITGGQKGSKYVDSIKFLDKVAMTQVPNSNGESWRLFDDDGIAMTDFLDPTNKLDEGKIGLCEGYKITIYAEDGTKIPNSCGYIFDAYNGILRFNDDSKPSLNGWGIPKFEGFVYIGKYVSDTVNNVDEKLDTANQAILNYNRQALAIQPFQFTTAAMTVVGDPYIQPLSDLVNQSNVIYMQQLNILIPGYVFELTAMDTEKTLLTEFRHLTDGNTEIFIEVPWSIQVNRPIMFWDWSGTITGEGVRTEQVGDYIFKAAAFVMNNGNKIQVKEIINYGDVSPIIVPSDSHYEYSTDVTSWQVPHPVCPPPLYGNPPANCGTDINININGTPIQ